MQTAVAFPVGVATGGVFPGDTQTIVGEGAGIWVGRTVGSNVEG